VTNEVPGGGGADEEPIEETKDRAPKLLRVRDRAITAEDYEFLARRQPGVAITRCLAPRAQKEAGPGGAWLAGDPWLFGSLTRAPGHVNLIVVPDSEWADPRPEPPVSLIQDVIAALDPCREVTADLRVTGPRYLPIEVKVDVRVFTRARDLHLTSGLAEVQEEVRERVAAFLHPVRGGPGGTGWQVGQSLYLPDIYQAVRPRDEIGYLADLRMRPVTPPPYHLPPIGPGGNWNNDLLRPFPLPTAFAPQVKVTDYELICFSGTCEVTGEEE
jgi:predicted phage baseplate assembly protein